MTTLMHFMSHSFAALILINIMEQKEFMLLFRMKPSNTAPTPEQIATMHQEWQKYIGGIASQARLVNVSRLDFKGATITNTNQVEHNIVIDNAMALSGNMTIKATDLNEAIELSKACPILYVGGSLEIRETIPMN